MMWLHDLRPDVRFAVRALLGSRGFTSVAILTLAVGIGANTAILSLVDTLMLRTLPVRQPEQLVEMLFKFPGDPRLNLYPWKHYERLREQNHVFSDLIAMLPGRLQVTGATPEPEVLDGMFVSDNFFDGLGLRPAIGRLSGPQDHQSGSSGAVPAVISWSYWQSRFNLDPRVLGRSLIVNDVPTTIVGVTPREFFGLQLGMNPPVWLPVAVEPLVQKPSRLVETSSSASLVGASSLASRLRRHRRKCACWIARAWPISKHACTIRDGGASRWTSNRPAPDSPFYESGSPARCC
jgi:hypothetical protein